MEEDPIHKALKNKIKTILLQCGLKSDSEIHFSFSSELEDDFSLDVCAIHDDILILFECKKSSKHLTQRLEHIEINIPKIVNGKITKILNSDDNKFKLQDFKSIKEVRYCYVIEKVEGDIDKTRKQVQKKGFEFWDKQITTYFYSISKILGRVSQYELLRELKIKPSSIDTHPEKAVRIEQNGQEMFLMGIHPSKLLEMAYVFRRNSVRGDSYQRIISGKKVHELKEFYREKKNLLLPNAVILVFDKDPEIQDEIKWNESKNQLRFPTSYCCAWIIDGQHRVYAFKDTPYEKVTSQQKEKFKIPVIAFRKLAEDKQSRTFVNINYYQTKINTILICDLAASFPDAAYELSWVSLLIKKLNKEEPFSGLIQTSTNEDKGKISIAGFARPYFLLDLLGYDSKTNDYSGPLYSLAKFDPKKAMDKGKNSIVLKKHIEVLKKFFKAAKKNSYNSEKKILMWDDKDYGLFGTWGINALLLVLTAILKHEKKLSVNFDTYLKVLGSIDFSKSKISDLPRGYGASTSLADEIINAINVKLKIVLKNSR